jgi:hypothetical protein
MTMSENGNHNHEDPLVVLAETENYAVLVGENIDDEDIYNIELGNVTLHLFREEWQELVELIKVAADNNG